MAFQPHGNQEVQNRKILQDLQERRRQMINQQAAATAAGANPGPSHVPVITRPGQELPVIRNPGENHQLVLSQRQALEQAHSISPGFYVCQDSVNGNLILPVIPRVENDS